jgi:hypothetical protein
VDSAGSAYVTETDNVLDFPAGKSFQPTFGGTCKTVPAGGATLQCFVAFVKKLNAAGSALVYSTYLGGGAFNAASGIAVDSSGKAYVTGTTTSTDFPQQMLSRLRIRQRCVRDKAQRDWFSAGILHTWWQRR